jgi:hypothetical protein
MWKAPPGEGEGEGDGKEIRYDMSMGNTVIIWSQVCLGTGMGLRLPYLSNTVPLPMVLWVSHDIVDQCFNNNNNNDDKPPPSLQM